jgi:hypothetical protein
MRTGSTTDERNAMTDSEKLDELERRFAKSGTYYRDELSWLIARARRCEELERGAKDGRCRSGAMIDRAKLDELTGRKKLDELLRKHDGTLRMDAYYYGFYETGAPAVDRILAAVALAGKMYHHTEGWTDEGLGDDKRSCVQLIQDAAFLAAHEMADLLARARRRETLEARVDNEKLDELELLEKAATPGPWESVSVMPAGERTASGGTSTSWSESPWSVISGPPQTISDDMLSRRAFTHKPDAQLIAATRNALPDLLARARRCEQLEQESKLMEPAFLALPRRCADLAEENAELRARVERLEAALRPFADPNAITPVATLPNSDHLMLRVPVAAIRAAREALGGDDGK